MGIEICSMRLSSGLRWAVGLALVVCVWRVHTLTLDDATVQMLDEELELVALNSNTTSSNITNTAQKKEPAPKKDAGKLQSYINNVNTVMKLKGKNPTSAEVTELANKLMLLDSVDEKTPRMREIEEKVRNEGPKETRLELSVEREEHLRAERIAAAKAKQEQARKEAKQAKELDQKKEKDEEIATQMRNRYEKQTMNPALEKQIEKAKQEFHTARREEKSYHSTMDEQTAQEHGAHDPSKWGPPDEKAKPAAATAATKHSL